MQVTVLVTNLNGEKKTRVFATTVQAKNALFNKIKELWKIAFNKPFSALVADELDSADEMVTRYFRETEDTNEWQIMEMQVEDNDSSEENRWVIYDEREGIIVNFLYDSLLECKTDAACIDHARLVGFSV